MVVLVVTTSLSAGLVAAAPDGRLYDPMRPQGGAAISAEQAPVEQELRLEVIVIADNRRSAVINGQNVVEGDQLKGYWVKTISADTVLLNGPSNYRRLTLHSVDQTKMRIIPVTKIKQ